MPDDLRIEGIASYAHTRVTNNAARGAFSPTNRRANVNQGEVACTAPEISDQNQFVMIERGLVIMCGGNGLHFERYGFETGRLKGRSKPTLGINIVVLVLGSHKMNRPSRDGRPDADSKLVFRLFSQIPENPCDQVLDCMPAAKNLRAVKVATAEERFEGLDQSPFHVRREILFNALGTRP